MYEHISAHPHSDSNREELAQSKVCGCFRCLSIYPPSEITQWVNEDSKNARAICAYCSVDSVIGDASGYQIKKELLQRMNDYWFEQPCWEIDAIALFRRENLQRLNSEYLAPLSIQVIEDETLDPYTSYSIRENGAEFFHTIYPKELLIRIAQILPNSEVRLTALDVRVGESSHLHETLLITIRS